MNKEDKIRRLNAVKQLYKQWVPFNSNDKLNSDLASLMGYESYSEMHNMDDYYTGSVVNAWCKGYEEALK